ncbi:MAG: hypothetical protein ABMA25_24505, partial [Ilumatobacteraceae bacterium]
WQIRVAPSEVGLFVSELIEVDFGTEGHGRLERPISNALGAPVDVRGFPWYFGSDNGDGTVEVLLSSFPVEDRGTATVANMGGDDGVVHGSPTTEILMYDLPVDPEGLSFDYEIIGGGRSLDVDEVTVYLVGLELSDASCRRASGKPCEVAKVANHYEFYVTSFDADDSLTIAGTVDKVLATTDDVMDLEFAESRQPMSNVARWAIGLSVSLLAALIGGGIARGIRTTRRDRRRRALAGEPTPDGAAIELPSFEPWLATALWHERVDLRSVRSWLAQQVAEDVLRVEGENSSQFARGDRLPLAGLGMAEEFERLVGPDGVAPAAPSGRISRMIRHAARRQRAAVPTSRWWLRFGPGSAEWCSAPLLGWLLAWTVVIVALVLTGWARSWPVTIALLALVPLTVTAAAVWYLAPLPTAEGDEAAGSLVRLRDSLHAVTPRQLERLADEGRLTECCVWAVAMGAADHWYDTVRASNIPRSQAFLLTAPLALGRTSGSWILTAA